MEAISLTTWPKSLPSLAMREGLVVTPLITPSWYADFISSILAVSMNSLMVIPPVSYWLLVIGHWLLVFSCTL